jgi:hypothetical protein
MNLYLIERPGVVDYDEMAGFVIYAATVTQARKMAAEVAADEGAATWLDTERSIVTWLGDSGPCTREAHIVLSDFRAG